MLKATSLKEIIDNSEIQSLLSDLIQSIGTPVSLEDINGNLLLGQSITSSTEEYSILVDQQTIGSVKGDSSVQIIAR
ncbi:MAG: GGDEF domain-containing protein, partial [Crocosphaera sp.]|nr:GGDEF domain-containing protein [Crocosphaera sp.]